MPNFKAQAEEALKQAMNASAETAEEVKTAETEPEEPAEEVDSTKTSEDQEEVDETPRVPYSRFSEVRQAQRDAERRAADLESRLAELEEERTYSQRRPEARRREYNEELPQWVIQAYGDTPEARSWYQSLRSEVDSSAEEARLQAIEDIRNEMRQETVRATQNEKEIDERFQDLEDYLGRPLSDEEAEAVLDIAADLTPEGDDGKFAGPLVSFEKAWNIYETQTANAGKVRKQSRDNVASLTSSSSNAGTPNAPVKVVADKDWKPQDWGGYRKYLPKQ